MLQQTTEIKQLRKTNHRVGFVRQQRQSTGAVHCGCRRKNWWQLVPETKTNVAVHINTSLTVNVKISNVFFALNRYRTCGRRGQMGKTSPARKILLKRRLLWWWLRADGCLPPNLCSNSSWNVGRCRSRSRLGLKMKCLSLVYKPICTAFRFIAKPHVHRF